MNSKNLFLVSVRLFFGKSAQRKWHALAPIMSIALSVIPIIVVLNVANGMIQGIINRFLETATYHIQAQSRPIFSGDQLSNLEQDIVKHPAINTVILERQGIGLLEAGVKRVGVTVRAVPHDLLEKDDGFRSYLEVVSGAFDLSQADHTVLGEHVAKSLGVQNGDTVQLISIQNIGGRSYPRITPMMVTGTISTGYRDLDRRWLFISQAAGQSLLAAENSRQIIGVKIDEPYALPNALSRAPGREHALSALRHVIEIAGDRFIVASWYEWQQSRLFAFRATKNILLFIASLVICVAMVHIISTLTTLATEKRTEITILKTYGTTPQEIRAIFVLCGFLVGIIASTIGIASGMFISTQINGILQQLDRVIAWLELGTIIASDLSLAELQSEYYLEHIPTTLVLPEILAVGWGTVFLAMLASFLPAKRAAQVAPLQVLHRH